MGKIAAAGRAAKSLNSPALQRARNITAPARPRLDLSPDVSPAESDAQIASNLGIAGIRTPENPDLDAVAGMAAEHLYDAQNNPLYPMMPRQGARLAAHVGGAEGPAVFSQQLFNSLMDSGAKSLDLTDSSIGPSQTLIDPGLPVDTAVRTRSIDDDPGDAGDKMGWAGGNVAMTRTTPLSLFDNLTGSPAASNRIIGNMQARNAPFGRDGAGIYRGGSIAQDASKPVTIYTGMKNGFSNREALGLFDPISRSIFYNRNADPMLSRSRRGRVNVPQHEFIHSLLDATPADQNWLLSSMRPETAAKYGFPTPRPGMADVDWEAMARTPSGAEASERFGDWSELANLMFHAKRLEEITNPQMRNLGDIDAANEWYRLHVGEFAPTGKDPDINLPGHPLEGQPAHGYERLMEWLWNLQNNAGPEADAEHIKLLHQLGDNRPDIRKALMS